VAAKGFYYTERQKFQEAFSPLDGLKARLISFTKVKSLRIVRVI
jgi:hypothetical protein